MWEKIKALKVRWVLGGIFCVVVYVATPSEIEFDMLQQFEKNINPTKYSKDGLVLPFSEKDFNNAIGVYHLTRFYEAFLDGESKVEHLTSAESLFEQAGNKNAINVCLQLRNHIKFNETEKIKQNAESNLAKWRPFYGEDLTVRYYFNATIICLSILLLSFSVEIRSFILKFKKAPEKINF